MTGTKIDKSDECKLITNLVISTKFCQEILPILEPKYFDVSYSKLVFKWAKEHFTEFQSCPGKYIKTIYQNNKADISEPEENDNIALFLSNLSKKYEVAEDYNVDFEIKQASKYIELQKLKVFKDDIDICYENRDTETANKIINKYPAIDIFESKELFTFISNVEIKPSNWLVKDLLEENTINMFFGESGAYKTFLAIDLSLSIASGKDWHGHDVKNPGCVLYLAGEGKDGMSKRCKAWSIYNDLKLENIPFALLNTKIQLLDDKGINILKSAMKSIETARGNIKLVVIDTWNRLSGAEENNNSDVSKILDKIDKIKEMFNCSFLIIHHVGISDQSRGRGATALHCGIDHEYKISKDKNEVITLEYKKNKEGPLLPSIDFEIEDIELGIYDEYGNVIKKGVIKSKDGYRGDKVKKNNKPGKNQRIALEILDKLLESNEKVTLADWEAGILELNPRTDTKWQTIQGLLGRNDITIEDGYVKRTD